MSSPVDLPIRDIHGLDPVGFWPPAPGWWLIAVATVLAGWFALVALRFVWRYPFFTWHLDARRRLAALRRRVGEADGTVVAAELSQLLRRIAIARHGRAACAGRVGDDWLEWLTLHDPEGFSWRSAGEPLLDLPYAPPGTAANPDALRRLVDAAVPWARRHTRLPRWPSPRRLPEASRG